MVCKSANILFQAFTNDIGKILPSANILKNASRVAANGLLIHSLEKREEYVAKLFKLETLPASLELHAPLTNALNFVTLKALTEPFANKIQVYVCIPRIVSHSRHLSFSSIEVVVLSKHTFSALINTTKRRCLLEEECTDLLKACEVNLTTWPISNQLAKYTLQKGRVITLLLRNHTFKGHKGVLATITVALIINGKEQHIIQTLYQYQHTSNNIIFKDIVR